MGTDAICNFALTKNRYESDSKIYQKPTRKKACSG